MKISSNWLKDYIKTDLTPDEIADKLTLTGLEVEETEKIGTDFEGVVVGEVLSVKKHPNADKLTLCETNTGSETVQIVCGAPNVAAGQKVAVATVGATLPVKLDDGSLLKIRKSKIRGEVSFGMICAEDELGLGSDHSGILVLETTKKPGTPFSEIAGNTLDAILEIGLTPNRPDAACHVGCARDLSAVTGLPLQHPAAELEPQKSVVSGHPDIEIRIENTDLCHRYAGIVMRGVKIKPSPDRVQQRLKAIGLRPRNAIVDATNYVMHELGQPLHAFDLHKIGKKEIIVKSFDKKVKFTTLDEIEREVPAGSLFICDGNGPVAIAGVMGGLNSEIDDTTTDILIESAWFNPVSVRKTSKELALQTDSSYRFERGVDPTITMKAALRCAQLISEWCGGEVVNPVVDVHPVKYEAEKITLRPGRANDILGTELDTEIIVEILDRLGFAPVANENSIECTVPGYRPDVSREIDLIEEVARIYDYNNIGTSGRITFSDLAEIPFEEEFQNRVRRICVNLGLQEFYNNSLLPEKASLPHTDQDEMIPTLNPISKDQAVLRPSLNYGFLNSAAYNFNRKAHGVRAFEIGHIFQKGDGTWIKGVDEKRSLLIGLAGLKQTEHWSHPAAAYTFHDLRTLTDAFLSQLRLSDHVKYEIQDDILTVSHKKNQLAKAYQVGGDFLKKFEIEYDVFIAEFDLDALGALVAGLPPVKYRPVPRFPAFEFDLAVVVDKQIQAGELENFIRRKAAPLIRDIHVFDVFEGKPMDAGQKSIAFRMNFQDPDRTLTIQDVQPVVDTLLKGMKKAYGAELRQ